MKPHPENEHRARGPAALRLTEQQLKSLCAAIDNTHPTDSTVMVDKDALRTLIFDHAALLSIIHRPNHP